MTDFDDLPTEVKARLARLDVDDPTIFSRHRIPALGDRSLADACADPADRAVVERYLRSLEHHYGATDEPRPAAERRGHTRLRAVVRGPVTIRYLWPTMYGVFCVVTWLTVGLDGTPTAPPFATLCTVVLAVWSWRLWRIGVFDDGSTAVVKNRLSTHRVPWTEIGGFELIERSKPGGTLDFVTTSRSCGRLRRRGRSALWIDATDSTSWQQSGTFFSQSEAAAAERLAAVRERWLAHCPEPGPPAGDG